MIIVPTSTPGVQHRPRRPDDGPPGRSAGDLYGGHAEIFYDERAGAGGEPRRQPGRRLRLAQQRLGPGRIHHAMRWLGQSQRAFDMMCERAVSRYTHGSVLAEKQMVQDWIADVGGRDPGRAPHDAARRVDDGPGRRLERPRRDRHDQVLGREGAPRRDRPRDPGARRARLLRRPAAGGDVPRGPRRPDLRRPRRGAQESRSPAGSCAATRRPTCPPSTCPPAPRRPGRSSPSTWRKRPQTCSARPRVAHSTRARVAHFTNCKSPPAHRVVPTAREPPISRALAGHTPRESRAPAPACNGRSRSSQAAAHIFLSPSCQVAPAARAPTHQRSWTWGRISSS